jgi:hypothetical protein
VTAADEFLAGVVEAAGDLLEPLAEAAESPESLAALLGDLGWAIDSSRVPGQIAAITALASRLEDLAARLQALAEAGSDPARLGPALDAARRSLTGVVQAVRALAGQVPTSPAPFDDPALWATLPQDLLDLLLVTYLRRHQPGLHGALRVLGVVREEVQPASGNRVEFTKRRLDLGRLASLAGDPGSLLTGVYGWGGDFRAQALLDAVRDLAAALGQRPVPDQLPTRLWDAGADPGSLALLVPLWTAVTVFDGTLEAGQLDVVLSPLPALGQRTGPAVGVEVLPRLAGHLAETLPLGPGVVLKVEGRLGGAEAVRVELRPGDIKVVSGAAGGTARVRVDAQPPAPWVVLGTATGSRLEVAQAHAELTLTGGESAPEVAVEAALDKALAVIDLSRADGFLRTILGSTPRSVEFAAGVRWSSRTGLRFEGSPTPQVQIPVEVNLGGVLAVDTAHLALGPGSGPGSGPSAGGAALEVALSGTLALGPIKVTVDRLGVRAAFVPRPDGTGSLGELDFRSELRPPNGVGLRVDAGAVTGAGFLSYDPEAEKYAGGVDLEFARLRLSAIGLLATRMPDGRPGFSLLLIVSLRFPKPIPLGFGFNLAAIGGLVGINRAVDVERMRAGLRSGSLSTILSPGDVVGNDRRLLEDLDRLFPVTPGRHLFGPTASITWGVPTVVTMDLALALELPRPLRFITAGRLRMLLPDERAPIAVINLDALGVLDIGEGSLALDATIYDSQIAGWRLSGDMALRARWTGGSQFVMSAGGFHPRFRPPPAFPVLRRMALAIGEGSVRIRMEAYLALTANTLQLGSRVELYARAGDFTAEGYFSFDAIVRFSPFGFELDLSLAVAIRWQGKLLLGITADLYVAGPGRWHVRGQATIKLLFLKATVRFKATFGTERALPPAPPEDVAGLVRTALAEHGAWHVEERAPLAALTLRSGIVLDGAHDLLVSPSARVTTRQKIAPVGGIHLDRFGQAPIRGDRELRIDAAALGGVEAEIDDVKDEFAPAQFFDLSDEEKLTRASFDLLPSGVSFTATGTLTYDQSGPDPVVIAYQTRVVDQPDLPARPVTAVAAMARGLAAAGVPSGADAVLGGDDLDRLADVGAAGRAATRSTGLARFDAPGLDLRVATEAFLVVATATLAPAGPQPGAGERWSRSEAAEQLRRWLAEGGEPAEPSLTVVPASEVRA